MKEIVVLCLIIFLLTEHMKGQWIQTIGVPGGVYALEFRMTSTLAGTDQNGIYRSTNNGLNWIQSSIFSENVRAISGFNTTLYAGTYDSGIYASIDGGQNWSQTSLDNRAIRSIAVDGENVFVGTQGVFYSGFYFSSNRGQTWVSYPISNYPVFSLCVSYPFVFAGTNHGLFKSTNNGQNWAQIGQVIANNILCISKSSALIAAGTLGQGVYISTNIGQTWTKSNFPDVIWVNSMVVIGSVIILGTSNYGVYVSSNNGSVWTQRNEGMGSLSVNSLCFSSEYIFAGTNGFSVWKRSLSELVGLEKISSYTPSNFSLHQNYPNPFNPTTKIRFDIPSVGQRHAFDVRLIIYDLLGSEVATLVNEQLSPGTYEVEWNPEVSGRGGSVYASGVYFYSLVAEEFTQTRKLILLK